MGEISEMVQEGILCQQCFTLMADLKPKEGNVLKEPPGHPRTCKQCKKGGD